MIEHLATERLILKPFQMDDVTQLHALFSNAFIRRYLWDDVVISTDQARAILKENEALFRDGEAGLWRVQQKEDNRLFGFVGLWAFFEESQPQLVYGLLPEFTREGFASEAAKRIIEFAACQLKFSYLLASCDAPNIASQAVAERIGMRRIKAEMIEGKQTLFYRIDLPKITS